MKIFPLASYRKWLLGVIAFSIIAWVTIYTLLQQTDCSQYDYSCDNLSNILAAFTWGYFIKSVIFSSFLVMFFSEPAFRWWKWFAIASIPLLVWWIIPPGGDLFGRQAADKVSAFFFLSASILIAISASIYNYFKLRKAK